MAVTNIHIAQDDLVAFSRRWRVEELSLFGSVLRDDFRPDSDVDVLVRFDTEAKWSLIDMVEMQDELEQLIGRKVDLVERAAVERSENYIRRKHILQTAEPIYVAG